MINRKLNLKSLRGRLARGQGLIETALLIPVIIILLSGLLEFGLMLNDYLTLQDAVRNAARYASDGLFSARDSLHNCTTTRDFYRQTACLVNQELSRERPLIYMSDNGTPTVTDDDYLDPFHNDDIVISAFSVLSGTGIVRRYPTEYGETGWSYAQDLPIYGMRNFSSEFSSSEITAQWNAWDTSSGHLTPSTGLLIVELFYHYDQRLDLPWITAFVPDPVELRLYAIMPLVSAEPTATPRP